MSLSGNLGFVSLDEVLRLLTRSKQSGTVDIKGDAVRGRVFVDRNGIALATTFDDGDLGRHLSRSGLLTADDVAAVADGSLELGGLAEVDGVTSLLREMSVESLYQMGLHGTAFEVREDQRTPFAAPGGFELEDLLAAARQRLTDWEEIRTIVSDLDRNLLLIRDLGERDMVTIDRDSWKVVSQIGSGVSIRGLADHLGTTEFWAARVAAGLVEDGLVSIESTGLSQVTRETRPASETVPAAGEWHEPVPTEPYLDDPIQEDQQFEEVTVPEPIDAAVDSSPEQDQPLDEPVVDPNQGWWREPEADMAETVEPAAALADEDPGFAQPSAAPAAHSDQDSVEEDTETFLEKVFSELDAPEAAEEGYGLLRRRRMGTLRDSVN